MKVSQNNQRLQKTKYLGSSAQDRVELENKQRVHRGFSATSNGERGAIRKAENYINEGLDGL